MMNTINNKPSVREVALEHGLGFSYDEDLIALILGSGTKDMPVQKMARKILETLDNSNSENVVANLLALKGIGQGKALAIGAALELGKRRNNHLRAPIRHPKDIVCFLQNYAVSNKEHFLVVALNGSHEILKIHVVSIGTLNRSIIHPREVFQVAIKENAASIILCHNHPSGNVEPSQADLDTTKTLVEASYIMGIEILDHIIISIDKYYSFMENDQIFQERKPEL